jgi:caa(3)-type oxidase subunit IV
MTGPAVSVRSAPRLLLLFVAVAALTGFEIASTTLAAPRAVRVTALAGLAIAKAGLVLWYFMHLGRQPGWLRAAVLAPIVFAVLAAVVVMLDTVARLGGGT